MVKKIQFDLDLYKKLEKLGKKCKLVTGKVDSPVRLVAEYKGSNNYCIAGVIEASSTHEAVSTWKADGTSLYDNLYMLVPEEYLFTTFQEVLVRDSADFPWLPQFFSHMVYTVGTDTEPLYACTNGERYKECIPYKGNEQLVNTK